LSSRPDYEFVGQPLEVKVYNNFDKAMKAFRALVQKERVLSTYKERSRYEKPSDKKRRKRNEMKRKLMELDLKYQEEQVVRKGKNKEED
jgi:ribosomal protein S21